MTTLIQHLRSATTGHVPSSLSVGEFGINEADGLLFGRRYDGAVAPFILAERLRRLATGSISNSAGLVLDISPATWGTMKGFIIHLAAWLPANDGVDLYMAMGDVNGLDQGATDYAYAFVGYENTAGFNYQATSGPAIRVSDGVGNASTEGLDATLYVGTNDTGALQNNKAFSKCTYINSDGAIGMAWSGGHRAATLDLTQIGVAFSAGNVASGRYELLGIP